jgi:hypothetical protein
MEPTSGLGILSTLIPLLFRRDFALPSLVQHRTSPFRTAVSRAAQSRRAHFSLLSPRRSLLPFARCQAQATGAIQQRSKSAIGTATYAIWNEGRRAMGSTGALRRWPVHRCDRFLWARRDRTPPTGPTGSTHQIMGLRSGCIPCRVIYAGCARPFGNSKNCPGLLESGSSLTTHATPLTRLLLKSWCGSPVRAGSS